MVSTTTGSPSTIATRVSAGVERVVQTASTSTKRPNSETIARPVGDSPMNGYSTTPISWAARSTADG